MANCWENFNLGDLNCNEICRLCLTREGEMSPIFSRPSDVKSISIPYRIMAFTSLKLETGDGLPGLICHSCLFNVERVYEFKQQCEQSDAFLRKYYSTGNCSGLKLVKEEIDDCVVKSADSTNSNYNNSNSNGTLHNAKISEEDNDGVVRSPLKQEPYDKDGIESVVMVVDPNARTLDASMSDVDNDNDNDHDDNDDLDYCRKNDMDVEAAQNHWMNNNVLANYQRLVQTSGAHHCPTCNKPFINVQLLERHIMIHNQEPYFPCDYCDSVFTDRAALKSHWRDHAGLGKLTCMTCGESFKERSALALHVVVHDIIKPYHCVVCNRAFSNRSDLRKHLIIHTGARPYICETCGKSFTRSTNLNKHARAHAGNRPFDCSKCLKKFSTRADLTRHSVTHTGEKPYSCEICGLSFSRRDKLTRHVKLHEKRRPFTCEDCALSFNNRKVLAAHFQIHHKDIDLPMELLNSKIFDDKIPKTNKNVSIANRTSPVVINLTSSSDEKSSAVRDYTEDVVINVDPFHLNNGNSDHDILRGLQNSYL